MAQSQHSAPDSTQRDSTAPAASATHDYAYYRRVFAGRRLPFAYLDLDLFDENIRQVVSRAGGKRIRVASKSVRSVAALKRILAADDRFIGAMCLTAREAVYLAEQGIDDLLIGYPCVHEADIADVARATRAGHRITLMVDDVAQIERIDAVARQYDVRLPLCIDIDLSLDVPGLHFGVWRSPLRSAAEARPVVERILGSPHLTLAGVMDLAGVLSFFGAALAIVNGGARIIFTLGRDGLFPRSLGWAHPNRGTPGVAIAMLCGLGLVSGLALNAAMSPIIAFGFLGTLDALFVLLIYLLVNIACIRFFWLKRRERFSVVRHAIIPALGVLITGGIALLAIISPGDAPLSYLPAIVGGWLALGLVVILVMRDKLNVASAAGAADAASLGASGS